MGGAGMRNGQHTLGGRQQIHTWLLLLTLPMLLKLENALYSHGTPPGGQAEMQFGHFQCRMLCGNGWRGGWGTTSAQPGWAGRCSPFRLCTARFTIPCAEAGKIKWTSLHLLSSHSLAIKWNFFLNSSKHRNQLSVWAVQLPKYRIQRSRFCSICKTTQTLGGCRRSEGINAFPACIPDWQYTD